MAYGKISPKQQEILDFLSTFQDGRFKPNPK